MLVLVPGAEKTEVEPSASARYSSPLQWSILTKNSWLITKSYDTSRLGIFKKFGRMIEGDE